MAHIKHTEPQTSKAVYWGEWETSISHELLVSGINYTLGESSLNNKLAPSDLIRVLNYMDWTLISNMRGKPVYF